MGAPNETIDLMNRFREQYESYRSPSYNETQLRREFIDPFFKALGWDIDNEQGYAEAYKDVIHEDSIKIGDSSKAPDYSFRIGGVRKFFVETKKPAVNIGQDVSPAFQLRRYAWSAKLPLSILTDFEEFAVYDCRVRPDQNDKASKARTLYLNYEQYDDQWDQIASIFSRDAILKGSFDKYVESAKKKRGTAEVDDAFLKDIEQWRSDLARNLAFRNKTLSQREINFAVQKTIDRIIFLRICEDRGIERYGQLQSVLGGPRICPRLCEIFRKADDRYNSGLFHFTEERNRTEPPDEWTLGLAIDDRVLKDIIQQLYYPESPYEFSVLSADILGQIYEQFLGKVIRLTKGHQARVEDKPEVKKAGGVYYTPTYIVDYIVEQAVGKLLEGKQPHEVAARTKTTWKRSKRGRPLKVLDPACGSGSFLIGAYQHLLDWYRDWYVKHDPKQFKDRLYLTRKNEWRLTTAERKRILLDHIYGVDIDPQAVEVTKLSLLLKVLEGENQETLQRQRRLFHERELPDLADNIKCGNSLIGPDFYQDKLLDLFDEEERLRINVFDWHAEFGKTLGDEGFDAVIGNPPYLNIRLVTQYQGEEVKSYFASRYDCAYRGYDLYTLFVERPFHLLRNGGRWGMIVPNKVATLDYALECRRLMLQQTTLEVIADVSKLSVFPNVGVYPYVIVWTKLHPSKHHKIQIRHAKSVLDLAADGNVSTIAQAALSPQTGLAIHGELDVESRVPTLPLSKRGKLHSGTTGFAAQKMAESLKEKASVQKWQHYEFVVSGNIDRYTVSLGNVRFMKRYFERPVLPINEDHLSDNKRRLYAENKIIFAGMTKRLEACYDDCGLALGVQVYAVCEIIDDPLYLLGILNSALLSYLFRTRFEAKHLAGGYLSINKGQLATLPIRVLDMRQPCERKLHDRIVQRVDHMITLHKQAENAKTTHDRTALSRQSTATDKEIDRLVHELYLLTNDEIRIVEESAAG